MDCKYKDETDTISRNFGVRLQICAFISSFSFICVIVTSTSGFICPRNEPELKVQATAGGTESIRVGLFMKIFQLLRLVGLLGVGHVGR